MRFDWRLLAGACWSVMLFCSTSDVEEDNEQQAVSGERPRQTFFVSTDDLAVSGMSRWIDR